MRERDGSAEVLAEAPWMSFLVRASFSLEPNLDEWIDVAGSGESPPRFVDPPNGGITLMERARVRDAGYSEGMRRPGERLRMPRRKDD